jgi:hypothetical protein
MKINLLGCLEILAGAVFLMNSVTDIQIGFGLVLVFMGINLIMKN